MALELPAEYLDLLALVTRLVNLKALDYSMEMDLSFLMSLEKVKRMVLVN